MADAPDPPTAGDGADPGVQDGPAPPRADRLPGAGSEDVGVASANQRRADLDPHVRSGPTAEEAVARVDQGHVDLGSNVGSGAVPEVDARAAAGTDADDAAARTLRPGSGRAAVVGVAVVVAGLAAGALVAALVASDGDEPPDVDPVVLAVATAYDAELVDARCAVDHLVADDLLTDDLADRLVDAAVAGPGSDAAAEPVVAGALAACAGGQLTGALAAAGVPAEITPCAAATVADDGAAAVAAAIDDPLAAGSAARSAVEACARDHLAATVQDRAGLDVADAQCVAGGVIAGVGLEAVLASIGALAVTAEVADAATEAATACATAAPG